MKRTLIAIFIFALAFLAFTAIRSCLAANVTFQTSRMKLKDKNFTMEIADTDARRELGLMHRDSMPDDHGMIFVFEKPDRWTFWMKNTKIPLDVVFLDASGKIIAIKPLKPFDETPVTTDTDSSYALEINRGTAAKLGLKEGDILALPENVLKRDSKQSP